MQLRVIYLLVPHHPRDGLMNHGSVLYICKNGMFTIFMHADNTTWH